MATTKRNADTDQENEQAPSNHDRTGNVFPRPQNSFAIASHAEHAGGAIPRSV